MTFGVLTLKQMHRNATISRLMTIPELYQNNFMEHIFMSPLQSTSVVVGHTCLDKTARKRFAR